MMTSVRRAVTSLADVIVVYLELSKLFGTFLRRRDAKRLLFVVVEVAGVARAFALR